MPQPIVAAADPYRRTWRALLGAQCLAFAAVGCYCICSQRYLANDGSYFFLIILNRHGYAMWDPAREFANLLTQSPVVFLIRGLGCRDVKLLGLTFGAGLFLLPLLGLALAWWAARKAPLHYLLYPLLSHSILFLSAGFFIISETHTAAALFWAILYLLVFSERLTVVRSVLLVGLAVVAMRSYEIYLFLAWPLLFCAWRRGRTAWFERRTVDWLTCGACCLLFLMAFGVALKATVVARDPDRRSDFALSLWLHLTYPPVWFSLLALACALWLVFQPVGRRAGSILWYAAGAAGLLVVLLPMFGFILPAQQVNSRVQALYVPLILGCVVVWQTTGAAAAREPVLEQNVALRRLTAWACAVAIVFQCGATMHWNRYRSDLLRELGQHRGVIFYEQSAVAAREGLPGLVNRQFEKSMGCFLPTLSITLGALNLESVSTIIDAPRITVWKPMDPWIRREIPDLDDYGVPLVYEIQRPSTNTRD